MKCPPSSSQNHFGRFQGLGSDAERTRMHIRLVASQLERFVQSNDVGEMSLDLLSVFGQMGVVAQICGAYFSVDGLHLFLRQAVNVRAAKHLACNVDHRRQVVVKSAVPDSLGNNSSSALCSASKARSPQLALPPWITPKIHGQVGFGNHFRDQMPDNRLETRIGQYDEIRQQRKIVGVLFEPLHSLDMRNGGWLRQRVEQGIGWIGGRRRHSCLGSHGLNSKMERSDRDEPDRVEQNWVEPDS